MRDIRTPRRTGAYMQQRLVIVGALRAQKKCLQKNRHIDCLARKNLALLRPDSLRPVLFLSMVMSKSRDRSISEFRSSLHDAGVQTRATQKLQSKHF